VKSLEEWNEALDALIDPPKGEKGDPRPLADLLRGGEVPPAEVLGTFAELLDPQTKLFDHKLVVQRTGAFKRLIEGTTRDARLAGLLRKELEIEPNVVTASENVAEREGNLSDDWPRKVWARWKRAWPKVYGREKSPGTKSERP
jgi:hypothetical protein